MINIQQNFSLSDIENDLNDFEEEIREDLIDMLRDAGKAAVDYARMKTREDGGFGNISYNLRASIGYAIADSGDLIELYFPSIGKGDHGEAAGKRFAEERALSSEFRDCAVLILCAGEKYAAILEAKDKDVISGSVDEIVDFFNSNLR